MVGYRLVSGIYDSGEGRCDTEHLNVHRIQFGPHREHRVPRVERPVERRIDNAFLY